MVTPQDNNPEMMASAKHLCQALWQTPASPSSAAAKAGPTISQAKAAVKNNAKDPFTPCFFNAFMKTSLRPDSKQIACQKEGRFHISNELKRKNLSDKQKIFKSSPLKLTSQAADAGPYLL